jgi:hypothetical protein
MIEYCEEHAILLHWGVTTVSRWRESPGDRRSTVTSAAAEGLQVERARTELVHRQGRASPGASAGAWT